MRGGILKLRRTGLGHDTARGRRGYDGLTLGDCRLSDPLLRLPPAIGQAAVQGRVTSIAEGPGRSHGFVGVRGTAVSIAQRVAAGTGQVAVRSTAAYVAVRTTATLGSVGVQGLGGATPPPGLTRTASGIVFYDDFGRADGALGGNWVDDAGTWSISSGQATSSGGNYDRNRNTGVSLADGIYEARMQSPSGGIYCGFRILAPGAADDFHIFMKGDNTDKRLARAANTDTTVASITMTMDTSYHVHKLRYTATRNFVYWFDRVAKLGSLGSPFNSGAGPTAAGAVGLIGYGGAPLVDWVLVSTDHIITVTGLSGTQGFRLFDPSDVAIGSSGTQAGGSATLDVATLFDGKFAGYLKTYDDAGTWSVPTTAGRYPPVTGNANDVAGGDSYRLG